jgi:2,3-bisphosphoglycerate-dependent phosphoglycerate mutase
MARVLLVRHCESSGPAPDAPLTPTGLAQADALADFLASHPIERVVSSPYLRARQTIAPFAARAGLEVEIDARWAERRLSAAPIPEWREVVRRSFDDLDHRAPGGESGRETQARGRAALDALLAAHEPLVATVSHGQLLSLLLHSIDARFGYAGWESLSFPDVLVVAHDAAGAIGFDRVWTPRRVGA